MTENLDQLREKAEAFIAASDRLDEVGLGIGGLMVHAPDAGRDHSAWSESTDYEHADTVLALIARVEAAEREAKAAKGVLTQSIAERALDTHHAAGIAVDEAVKAVVKLIVEDPSRRAREAEARAEAAERAVQRAKAVDALQRRDKGALYRRGEAAEAAVQRVRELNRFLPASIMERITHALDGGE